MVIIYFLDIQGAGVRTPVNVAMLKQLLTSYWNAEFILQGFISGFSLGVIDKPCFATSKLKLLPVKPALRVKVDEEIGAGRFLGPFSSVPIPGMVVSPLTAIPKPCGEKHRLIFNLSSPFGGSVNDNIHQSQKSVQYCSVTDVAQWLLDNETLPSYLAKVDLADAFRIIPIKKEDWKYLGIRLGNSYYVDRCLPMGAASSCRIFQAFSDALVWMFMARFSGICKIFNYLDDFLIWSITQEECELALNAFIDMLKQLGVPVSGHKTVHSTTSLVFLGIGIDTKKQALFLPPEKVDSVQTDLLSFLKRSAPRVKDWQKILGKLCHLSAVVTSGRIFLSSLYGSLQGILSRNQSRRVRISVEAAADLMIWVTFLEDLPPEKEFRMLRTPCSGAPTLASDASTSVGYGLVYGNYWFYGNWPNESWKQCNIALLELYPIFMGVCLWKKELAQKSIIVLCDNQAVVAIINRLYSKDPLLRKVFKPLALTLMNYNIQLSAIHIEGHSNVGPDLLSRGKILEFRKQFTSMCSEPTLVPAELLPINFPIF